MKKLSPTDWVNLSKQGLGLGDVITMAYVNQASLNLNMKMSNDINPDDFIGLPELKERDNDFVDAMRYALGVKLFRSNGDDFFELADGPVLHEEESFGGYIGEMPKAPTKRELINLYVPHGMIKISTPLADGALKKIREEWDKVNTASHGIFRNPIIGDHSLGIEPCFSNTYQRKSDPVYNNTLQDFNNARSNEELKLCNRYFDKPETKQCDCGAQKTYGKDCKTSFHSSWCSIK